MLRRVAFTFPGRAEQVHYLRRSPERGDTVHDLKHDVFVVSHAERDNGGWVATCVTRHDFLLEPRP